MKLFPVNVGETFFFLHFTVRHTPVIVSKTIYALRRDQQLSHDMSAPPHSPQRFSTSARFIERSAAAAGGFRSSSAF